MTLRRRLIQVVCSRFIGGSECAPECKDEGRIGAMMKTNQPKLKDGAKCKVIDGTHVGKSGIVKDINTSKTGHVTITVEQGNGERFKTLAKNVET
jgi:hypothetical protein